MSSPCNSYRLDRPAASDEGVGTAVTTAPAPEAHPFDPERAWELASQVALRPESFGALAYHFGTRRLSFLTSPLLLSVVEALPHHPSAREACLASGVPDAELARYEQALSRLAERGMLSERTAP